jgi:hypothetical protein
MPPFIKTNMTAAQEVKELAL